MRSLLVVALCVLVGSATADRKSQATLDALGHSFGGSGEKLPLIALADSDTKLAPTEPVYDAMQIDWDPLDPKVAFAADGSASWIAAGLMDTQICGMEGCEKIVAKARRDAERKPPYHATALVDGDQPIVLHVGSTGAGVGHGAAMTAQIDDAANDAVKLFESTIGDPSVFAATVSTRKDVVLFGTEATERFIGGDVVRATLVKWGLSFATVGGIRAGTTKSKTVAWVAADVDARAKKATKPAPYRLTVIYEKTGANWRIVQIHFS